MSNQLEFEIRKGGSSQCTRILAELRRRAFETVPMPELARIGSGSPEGFCMVHSRIADLRKKGHVIQQSQEWIDGNCHSFYCWKGYATEEAVPK